MLPGWVDVHAVHRPKGRAKDKDYAKKIKFVLTKLMLEVHINEENLINARYWFAPVLIIVTMFGVLMGGMFSWVGLLLLGVGIVIDTLLKFRPAGGGVSQSGETIGVPWLQNGIMYGMLGVFVLLQLSLAWRIYQYVNGVPVSAGFDHMMLGFLPFQNGIAGLDLIGATISTGIFAGIGIIYGHELSHTKGFAFAISRTMMALSGKAHFSYAHVYNHHLELGHEDDPATAPRRKKPLSALSAGGNWAVSIPVQNGGAAPGATGQVLVYLGKPLVAWLCHDPANSVPVLVRGWLDRYFLSGIRMASLELRA